MPRNVARGAILGIAGQAWHLVTAFLLFAFLARKLGPAGFGEWRVVLSVLNWFEIVLYSGLIKVTTKALAENPENRARLSRAGYLGQSLVALVAFTLMLVLAGPIAGMLSDRSLAVYIRISALDIPLYAIFMAASALLLGRQRFERQSVAWIVYATAKFVAVGGLVLFGFSVPGALIGNALASLVGFAAAFVPIGGAEQRERLRDLWPIVRSLLVAAVPFLTLSLTEGLGTSADLWLVSALVSSSVAVGWYASATALADVPTFLFTGLERIIFPSVSGARAEGDSRLAGRYATQALRLAIIVTLLGVAVIAATGRQALTLVYSAKYLGAYVPLAILMVAAAGRTVRAMSTEILMARDERRTAITILVATVVLEIVLLLVLTSRWSLAGAATSAAIAGVVAGTWGAISIRDMVGVRPLLTLARSALAALAVGVALYYIAPASAWLLLAYPLAGVVYLGLLVLLREFDASDFGSVRNAFQR